MERAVRVGNVLDASVQIGIGQRAGHSRVHDMGRRKPRDQSGGTVEQMPAGNGEIKARLGASGGGRSRHHFCCGPGRPYMLAVTEGRGRRRGGTKEAEAGRRSATGRCAGRSSGSARAPSVIGISPTQRRNVVLLACGTVMCARSCEVPSVQACDVHWGIDAAFHARYENGMGIKVKKRENDTARRGLMTRVPRSHLQHMMMTYSQERLLYVSPRYIKTD